MSVYTYTQAQTCAHECKGADTGLWNYWWN